MTQFSGEQASKLLAPPHRVPWQDILDEWFGSFEQIEADSLVDVCLNHMTDYKHQRRVRPVIDAARWFCLPFYPYIDNHLYTAYYSLPEAHLKHDQAHSALLSDYKLGLENVRTAAIHFGMPFYKEYRYRHFIYLGRVARDRFLSPLQRKWQETKGTLGFGQNVIYPHWESELKRLADCHLFNWPQVQNYIVRARSGRFVNQNAIYCLRQTFAIDDFLFNPNSFQDESFQLVNSRRDIRFCPLTEQ
jgi:hypothetical protein